jgi:hypothetical protein
MPREGLQTALTLSRSGALRHETFHGWWLSTNRNVCWQSGPSMMMKKTVARWGRFIGSGGEIFDLRQT